MSIIKLSSYNSQIKYDNSHWINNLNQTVINPQQQIILKNVFLDTRNQISNVIEIEEDTDIGFKFGYCVTYCNNQQFNLFNLSGAQNQYFNDANGNNYLLYKIIEGSSPKSNVTYFTYRWNGTVIDGSYYGGFVLTFRYKYTVNGFVEIKSATLNIPKIKHTKKKANSIPVNLIIDTDTIFDIVYTSNGSTKQITPGNFTQVPIGNTNNEGILELITSTINVILPRGSYSPLELVDKVNSLFQEQYRFIMLFNNPLLTLIRRIVQQDDTLFLITEDNKVATKYNDNDLVEAKAVIIGTNQININFDENLNKFQIQQTHMPIYNTDGDIIKVFNLSPGYLDESGNIFYGQQVVCSSEQSSIFILNWNDLNFWQNTLGFDSEITCNLESYRVQTTDKGLVRDISGSVILYPNVLVKTQNLITIDDTLLKNNTFLYDGNEYYIPASGGVEVVSDNLQPINASFSYLESTEPNAFYLVEVNIKGITNDFNSDLIEPFPLNKKILGVVSKYYTVESYITGGEETSINFINNSNNQIIIDSIEIRILNPDFTEANLGLDNTVILQII